MAGAEALRIPQSTRLPLLPKVQHAIALRDTSQYQTKDDSHFSRLQRKHGYMHMPCGAMHACMLQVLVHTLVVLDLSRDRNGYRLAAGWAIKFNRTAAWFADEPNKLNTGQCAARSTND